MGILRKLILHLRSLCIHSRSACIGSLSLSRKSACALASFICLLSLAYIDCSSVYASGRVINISYDPARIPAYFRSSIDIDRRIKSKLIAKGIESDADIRINALSSIEKSNFVTKVPYGAGDSLTGRWLYTTTKPGDIDTITWLENDEGINGNDRDVDLKTVGLSGSTSTTHTAGWVQEYDLDTSVSDVNVTFSIGARFGCVTVLFANRSLTITEMRTMYKSAVSRKFDASLDYVDHAYFLKFIEHPKYMSMNYCDRVENSYLQSATLYYRSVGNLENSPLSTIGTMNSESIVTSSTSNTKFYINISSDMGNNKYHMLKYSFGQGTSDNFSTFPLSGSNSLSRSTGRKLYILYSNSADNTGTAGSAIGFNKSVSEIFTVKVKDNSINKYMINSSDCYGQAGFFLDFDNCFWGADSGNNDDAAETGRIAEQFSKAG